MQAIIRLILLGAITYICLGITDGCQSSEKERLTNETLVNQFVGSSTCKSCHKNEYSDWEKSDHYLAMQHASDSSVLANFNNSSFTSDGVTYRFFRRDGKFYINTQGNDGRNYDFEVLYTFGYYPLQQYLVAFPGGRLQSTRVAWDSREKKWFHQYSGQNIHHKDWLHWTGNGQNWNTMCSTCHSTNLQKNYSFELDSYKTTWNEINVSCESCHGPGSNHINFISSEAHRHNDSLHNSGFLYARSTNPQLQLNTCAPCHARKSDISNQLIHSNEIMDNMIPAIISDEFYFADGQIKEEDYEYGSFAQSKMFHKNVRCSSCHNPHSGKLKLIGNDLCMSCHEPKYNTKEHHFHTLSTAGAQCINCHMPVKTFMGNDHRRDHSFRIPRPDQSVNFGTPNTCTGCHTNQTNTWAAETIRKWRGPTRTYHFSDDLLPGSELTNAGEKHLLKLLKDTLQPEIARATAAHYLGNIQTQSSADALVGALKDKGALVRYHALRSLENFTSEVWVQTAYHNLTDKVRAVRIAAADLYLGLPPEAIPTSARNAYSAADVENRKYLQYQTDFAVGNVMLADYEMQSSEHLSAIKHYLRGLEKDSLMNYARLNLAAAYNSTGKNIEALSTLNAAAAIDPQNDHIFYNLGLLYYEMRDNQAAMDNFQKAVQLHSRNPSLFYNYGLLLQQQGRMKEAELILLQGFSLDPQAVNVNYALSYMYMNQNLPTKARKHALVLQKNDPNNPKYKELFKGLGL